jgi:dolichol-phosphate mannosyltransferase
MKISLVIPVRDEAENLQALSHEIDQVLTGIHEYEIIFVDDGSRDQSRRVLSELQRRYPRIRPLYHRHSFGQSAALLTGIRHAVHPVIVTLDGDGQNDPRDIGMLLNAFERCQGSSDMVMVIGHRSRRKDTGWRRLSSRVANGVRSRVLGDGTPDSGCGLKVISRELYLSLPAFDHMHRFLPSLVKRRGGKTITVPVRHRPRKRGRSHYGTLDRLGAGIVDLLGVIWLMRRTVDVPAAPKILDTVPQVETDRATAQPAPLPVNPQH